MKRTISAALLALAVAACGAGPDTVTETCQRLDECNVLATSVSECIETFDVILDGATPTDRADFERSMDFCLEFQGCSTFLDCAGFDDAASDTSDPGGDTPGGGGPAPSF